MQRLNYMLATPESPAACAPHPTQAAGTEVLSEDFGNLADSPGWARVNRSIQPGAPWCQGNPDIFPAQAGVPDAYAAASCLSAAHGIGRVDNWLITPTLTLSGLTTLSFVISRERVDGFDDLLEVRFGRDSGTAAASFDTLLASIGGAADFPAQWQPWHLDLTVDGAGRFAFRYLGDAARLSHVGLDAVRVVTRLPEPTSRLLLAEGLGVLGLLRRHERH
ncbi:choice-of-anchor J domain-containing protein [Oxalobacteraceae sp. CFBP 8761]|nr:choice-of-anchor J domain-containing protein [Oxalobacteraceae sp. CFBP 8761]